MRLIRILAVSLGLGCFGISAGGAGCSPVSDFQCSTHEDCRGEGAGGVCESNSFCSFPDTACPSGKRWHDRASSLAGMCFGEGAGTATDGDTDDPPMASSGTTEDPTEDPTADPTTGVESTTEPGSATDDPTTGDPLTTGDPTTGDPSITGSGSGSGGAASCNDMYGAATDYMLCEETPDSCRFNVTTGMASSCDMVCESFGGACVGAQLNEAEACTSTGDTTCDDAGNNDLMCICSR